jgi:HSP20 family protein
MENNSLAFVLLYILVEVRKMKLVPWRKREDLDSFFAPVVDFRKEMDRLFDSFFGKGLMKYDEEGFTPKIELSEDEKSYTVKAELPGMDKEDISVNLEDNVLTLRGEKKEEKEEKKKNSFYSETRYGSFHRQIPFRHDVDDGKVDAHFKKGILTMTLPKKKVTESKSIKINVD